MTQLPQNKVVTNVALAVFVLFLGVISCNSPDPKEPSAPTPEVVKTEYKFEDDRLKVADSLRRKRKYADAAVEYEKVKSVFKEEGNWEGMVYSMNQLANVYRRIGRDDKASENFQEAKSTIRDEFGKGHPLLAQAYYLENIRIYRADRFIEASRLIDSAWNYYSNSPLYDSLLLKNIIRYKFYTYYFSEENLDTCIKYLDMREKLIEEHSGSGIQDQTTLFGDYIRYYRKKNDLEKAQIYAQQNLMLLDSQRSVTGVRFLQGMYTLGSVYFDKLEYDKSLEVSERLLDSARTYFHDNHLALVEYFNLKAISLNGLGRFEEALSAFKRTLAILDANSYREDAYWGCLQNMAFCYSELGDNVRAENLFKEALKGMQHRYGLLDPLTSNNHYYLGNFYTKNQEFEKALIQYDSSLMGTTVYSRSNPLALPKIEGAVTKQTLITLRRKARTLTDFFDQRDDDKLLEAAVNYSEFSDSLLTANRHDYQFTEGRLFLADYFKSLYETALDATFKLWRQEGTNDLVEKGLDFMARSKSVLFLDQAGEYDFIMNSTIPDTLRDSYLSTLKQMEILDEELTDLLKTSFTSERIQELNAEKMAINKRLVGIISYIGENFAESGIYTESNSSNAKEIQQTLNQSPGRLLIEYFVGENHVYSIGVSGTELTFNRFEISAEYNEMVDGLIEIYNERPIISEAKKDFETFTALSHEFYETLIAPSIAANSGLPDEIIIVPDEHLSRLPFGTALVSFNGEENFKDLNYLIKDVKVNYLLSSILLKADESKVNSKKRMLGFGFSGDVQGGLRGGYADLPGTVKEISFLEENVKGDYFIGETATKQEFSKRAKDYGILHLAIHGEADLENRFRSGLIFNGSDDNVLRGNDLYDLGLKANLVVLSACESGVGEIKKGEGTFSIARSFAIAGIPSIVMSLWKVDDDVASNLMVGFHRNLVSDMSVTDALHKSKLDYLMDSDEYGSHPYYWSTFVPLNGDVEVITTNRMNLIYLVVLVALLISIFLFRKILGKKRKESI